jgi:hypothetical protein
MPPVLRAFAALEARAHGDVLLLDCAENADMGKTYTYFASLPAMTMPYDYVMKVDDDTFLLLDALVETLAAHGAEGGRVLRRGAPVPRPGVPTVHARHGLPAVVGPRGVDLQLRHGQEGGHRYALHLEFNNDFFTVKNLFLSN